MSEGIAQMLTNENQRTAIEDALMDAGYTEAEAAHFLNNAELLVGIIDIAAGGALIVKGVAGKAAIVKSELVATKGGLSSYSTSQLQHEFKHASDFGISGNWNKANGEAFQTAINSHISDPAAQVIQGTYKGQPVTHYYNPTTGNDVFVRSDGSYWGGWKLSQDQINHVTTHGGLN